MKYMCPECGQVGMSGRCCTDKPIPLDEEAIEETKSALERIRMKIKAEEEEIISRIRIGRDYERTRKVTRAGGKNS